MTTPTPPAPMRAREAAEKLTRGIPDWQMRQELTDVIAAALLAASREALMEFEKLRAECEEHRIRYNGRPEGKRGYISDEYWRGRRDEAGWVRDRLAAALEALRDTP